MENTVNKSVVDPFLHDSSDNSHTNNYPSYVLEKQLLREISQGNEEEAMSILKSMNRNEYQDTSHIPFRSIKNSLIGSATLFARAIISGGVLPKKAFSLSNDFMEKIEETDSIAQLEAIEYEMVGSFTTLLNKEAPLPYSKCVNRSITYIHEHILDDITLEDLANHSSVSSSYLSHLFKKEVGLSLVSFINQKRVEESKYFLLHTNTSISDISELFQFCNQSYYTSLFKKHTNQTPREFREQHIEQSMTS